MIPMDPNSGCYGHCNGELDPLRTAALTMMSDSVEALIRYVVAGERAVFYPSDRERSYWPVEDHRLPIANMRARVADLALERNGFVLLREPSTVTDFHDAAQVRK